MKTFSPLPALPDLHHIPVDPRRISVLNNREDRAGRVIYWMSRDQRVSHNWALLFARYQAKVMQQPLHVLFTLVPSFPGASRRHYEFMLCGLQEVEEELRALNIPFSVITGDPVASVVEQVVTTNAGLVVTDYSPLDLPRRWKTAVAAQLPIPLYEVDAHNIVPCLIASGKQEYSARTLRPKIHRLLPEFLVPFPPVEPLPFSLSEKPVEWSAIRAGLKPFSTTAPAITWLEPGERAAQKQLGHFLRLKLSGYARHRNDPNAHATSQLSPYLHFGQISAQHVAQSVIKSNAPEEDKQAFLEELIVRRELAENYCARNPDYDSFDGIPAWAQQSLEKHRYDHREYLYTREQFQAAATHDPLWNAAQRQLVKSGIIHGYLRMYWAKKILEWSPAPREAFAIALALNDTYALDGRDPNGYTGVAWSIGGVHDRPWFERPVFGAIRYMNSSGCARKFDVKRYIESQ